MQIGRIMYRLLRRLPEEERFAVMKEAVSSGRGLLTVVHEAWTLVNLEDKEGKALLTEESIKELKKLTAERINNCLLYTSDAADE